MTSTVDPKEMAHFTTLASQWWDESGSYKLLHQINPLRLSFIRQAIGLDSLQGLRVLDVGCGGGLISEPLARLGASVVGLDGALANIEAAQTHALVQGLSIDYRHASPEALVAQGETFDVVLALEVLEHTVNPQEFIEACGALTRPEGTLILSTLNQTIASYLLGIVAAEQVLGWVPKGTHQWRKFMKPRALQQLLFAQGFQEQAYKGMHFSLSQRTWVLGEDLSVNYFVSAQRQKTGKKGSKHLVGELSSWG